VPVGRRFLIKIPFFPVSASNYCANDWISQVRVNPRLFNYFGIGYNQLLMRIDGPKHLLGLRFLSQSQISRIVEQATAFKAVFDRTVKQVPTLRGKTFATLFLEPSTRTKTAFEMAIKLMGASSITVAAQGSSFKKGESLFDTVQNLEALGVDGVIIRHSHSGAPHFIAQHVQIPVINAGDGFNEHPTQGLLDLMTMMERLGPDMSGKNVMILGDVAHSRVARSNIWALKKMGASVFVCGPRTLMPVGIESMGVTVLDHPTPHIPQMDVINVLRVQYERQEMAFFPSVREYRQLFGLTKEKLKKAKKNVLIMHPGPMNRGIEIDSDVAEGPNTVILDQVVNGVAIRMAVLYELIVGKQ
jgi:aspartate carbamoyltransferase catalytic subunit